MARGFCAPLLRLYSTFYDVKLRNVLTYTFYGRDRNGGGDGFKGLQFGLTGDWNRVSSNGAVIRCGLAGTWGRCVRREEQSGFWTSSYLDAAPTRRKMIFLLTKKSFLSFHGPSTKSWALLLGVYIDIRGFVL